MARYDVHSPACQVSWGIYVLAFVLHSSGETFPVLHREPITIRIVDGKTGPPLTHVHLAILGGIRPARYSQRDVAGRDDNRRWRQCTIADLPGELSFFPSLGDPAGALRGTSADRSEERRVGKEC